MDTIERINDAINKKADMFDVMIDREMDRTIEGAIVKVRMVFPMHTNEIAELIALGDIEGSDAAMKLMELCCLTSKDTSALLNNRVSFEEIMIEELRDASDY